MIRVHLTPPEILDKEVTYFSSKNDLDRFRKTFLIYVLVESKEQAISFLTVGANDDVAGKESVNDASINGESISQEGTDDDIENATDGSNTSESPEEGILKLDGDQGLEKQPSTSTKMYKCSPNDRV